MTDVMLYLFIPPRTDPKRAFIASFPPLALFLGASAALFFLDRQSLQWTVVGVHAALQMLYGIRMRRFMTREGYPDIFFYETVSVVLLVSYFFFSFSFYALVYFLGIPIWYGMVPFMALTFLFFLTHLWMRGAFLRDHGILLGAYVALIAEAILVIRWLPSLYHVNAFFITVLYFISVSLGIDSLRREIHRGRKLFTIILSSVMVLLLMLTAQWR